MGWPRTEHSREAEAEGSRNSRTSAIDRRWSIASPTTKRLHSRLPVQVPRPYWNFNVQGVATSSSPGVASIHIPHLHTIHSVVTGLICHLQCILRRGTGNLLQSLPSNPRGLKTGELLKHAYR